MIFRMIFMSLLSPEKMSFSHHFRLDKKTWARLARLARLGKIKWGWFYFPFFLC